LISQVEDNSEVFSVLVWCGGLIVMTVL